MKLNIYKNQNEIVKTYKTDAYDLMYGTVEDLFEVIIMDDNSEDRTKEIIDTFIDDNKDFCSSVRFCSSF